MTQMEEIYVRIGKNLTFLRAKKKLTQEQLALDSSITSSQSVISQYERGKKTLSLAKIEEFSNFFGVTIEELMFSEFKDENESTTKKDSIISENDPINKCLGRTYFCYYIKEQNGSKKFIHRIESFELKILEPLSSHKAKVRIFFPDRNKKVEADLHMDGSYAYIKYHDLQRDFYLELTFFYHRRSLSLKYDGGMGLLQTLDYHRLPICQFCIISANAIATRNQSFLERYLKFDIKEDINIKLSTHTVSSSSILRLTKSIDLEVFNWLKQNVGL